MDANDFYTALTKCDVLSPEEMKDRDYVTERIQVHADAVGATLLNIEETVDEVMRLAAE